MPAFTFTSLLQDLDPLELRFQGLVFLLCLMLMGVFPTVVILFSHGVVYLVWAILWALLVSFWMEMPVHRLLIPMTPFILWMVLYAFWGTLAAPYAITEEALRFLFRFGTLAICMAVVTSTPGRFRLFTSWIQWVLVVNLAVTMLLMYRPEYQQMDFFQKLAVDVDSDRFAGLWGNANQAGLASLLILVLSHWASRWHALIGRVCGLSIIYLTASRTAIWILVALSLLYLVFVATSRFRLNALLLILLVALGSFFTYKGMGSPGGSFVDNNPILVRVLDVSESRSKEIGQESRMDLLQHWLKKIPQEPWYGYGLFTLAGGKSEQMEPRPGFPDQGPHNLYVGILMDVGIVGLVSWLILVAWQLNRIRRKRLLPSVHRAMFAFCFILLVFSVFNHNMLSEYVGWMCYSLMFLMTSTPALHPGFRPGSPAPFFPRN